MYIYIYMGICIHIYIYIYMYICMCIFTNRLLLLRANTSQGMRSLEGPKHLQHLPRHAEP
jgi:hypothetical protein